MEENRHSRLIRRQLSESLDLNEALTSRIEQLKAYIWRAGLEVPKPEDGVHGPIVERESTPMRLPAKRQRTDVQVPEASESLSLAALEASLDRSVRLAIARSLNEDSKAAVLGAGSSPSDRMSKTPLGVPQSPSVNDKEAALPNYQASEGAKEGSGTGTGSMTTQSMLNNRGDSDAGTNDASLQTSSVGLNTHDSALSHSSPSRAFSARIASTASLSFEGPSNLRASPSSERENATKPVDENAKGIRHAASGLITDSSSDSVSDAEHDDISKGSHRLLSNCVHSPHHPAPGPAQAVSHWGPQVSSPRIYPEATRANWRDGSPTAVIRQSQREQESLGELKSRGNPGEHQEERQEEYQEEFQEKRQEEHQEQRQEEQEEERAKARQETSLEEPQEGKQLDNPPKVVETSGENVFTQDVGQLTNSPSSSEPEVARSEDHSPPPVEMNVPESVSPKASSSKAPSRDFPTPPATGPAQWQGVLRQPQGVDRTDSSGSSSVPSRAAPALAARRGSRIGNEEMPGNHTVPNTFRDREIETPVMSHSEPRVSQRPATTSPFEVSRRKPRDDWAMQFRESFSQRKARSILERADVSGSPGLSDSVRRIADNEKRLADERNGQSLSSLQSHDVEAERSSEPLVLPPRTPTSQPVLEPVIVEQSPNASDPSRTVTPRGARRYNVRSPSLPHTSTVNSQSNAERTSPMNVERRTPPSEPYSRSIATNGDSPGVPSVPHSMSHAHPSARLDMPPLPPVPQSIMKRLSSKLSGSPDELGATPPGDIGPPPFTGSVRPPLTSTPTTKLREVKNTASTHKETPLRHDASSPRAFRRSRLSPNSSVYQSAMQSFESGNRRTSDEPQGVQASRRILTDQLFASETHPVPPPVQPLADIVEEKGIPLKFGRRGAPLANSTTAPSAAAGERALATSSTALQTLSAHEVPLQAPSASVTSQQVGRRVSFRLPGATKEPSEPTAVLSPKPKVRRKLVRSVYPVDLSDASQVSLPDMSVQAANEVGDISEYRERPALNSNGKASQKK